MDAQAELKVRQHPVSGSSVQAGRALLAWYDEHKRDLPWRRSRDPYAIWVSEIMLQQTRVAAVLEHYARWMERFPTVGALARAEEPEVLALWSGLGYYRRARMLHRAARVVAAEHGGVLPRTAAELRALPGIGEYTSAAVASIAYGEPVAVVDGNVERIVTRIEGLAPLPVRTALDETAADTPAPVTLDLDEPNAVLLNPVALNPVTSHPVSLNPVTLARAIREGAQALVDPARAGDSNQAMMELGATVCLPRGPLCLHCPVQPWCRTRGEHATVAKVRQTRREIAYALHRSRDGERVLLRQRPGEARLMAGMWELPELAGPPENDAVLLRLKHSITVTDYTVSILETSEEQARAGGRLSAWVALDALPELPLTGLCRKVLRRLGLWPALMHQG